MSDIYLGNNNLKRAGVVIDFKREQIEEFVKCSQDPVYFCENYVKIVSVDKGLIPFRPYEYQKTMFKQIVGNRFTICKMPRQVGKTTGVVGLLLWYVLFNENYSIAVLANKEKQSREILGRVQLAYEWLPKWLQQGIVEWNKSNIVLENGSKIMASSTSSSAIRGQSYNMVYLDEFAFVPRNIQDQFFASTFPTISSGQTSKVVITSTPNGMDLFHKLWVDSEHDRNTYVRVDVHWSDVPGRDEAWRDEMIRNTSEQQFKQEFECEFLGSTNTLISGSYLSKMVFYPPIESMNGLDIYEKAKPNHTYICSADTSRGVGLDYSAFVIVDVTEFPYKVVAKFRDNMMEPVLFPTLIINTCRHYNDAYVLVEVNDNGQQIVDMLYSEFEYENVVMTQPNSKVGIRANATGGKKTRLGVKTTTVVKKVGCSNFKSLVENNKLFIPDYDIIQELASFIAVNSSFQAEEGKHDDLVMCLVLFSWLANQQYFRDLTDLDYRKHIALDNERFIEEQLTPFGMIEDGRDEYQEENGYRIIDSNSFERDLLL